MTDVPGDFLLRLSCLLLMLCGHELGAVDTEGSWGGVRISGEGVARL